MYFNQPLKRFDGSTPTTFNVKIGNSTYKANLDSVYKETELKSKSSGRNAEYALPTNQEFDSLRFCLKIPEMRMVIDLSFIFSNNSASSVISI